jgi:hypothetical protein
MAGTFLAAGWLVSTPAAATGARGAIRACDTNSKNCSYNVSRDGSVDIQVTQSDGKKDWVSCPTKGDCVCMTCRTTGKGGQIDPSHVLAASSSKARVTTGTATTDKTVRDHRGANGAPQGGVSVGQGKSKTPKRIAQSSGPLGGPKNKGGYGGLNGSGDKGNAGGPTIRDHRKGK